METLAGSLPVGFSWVSRASSREQFRVWGSNLSSRVRSPRACGKIGLSFGESRIGGAFPVSLAPSGRNFYGGSWRLIPAASSGKNGKTRSNGGKDGGRAKSHPEKKPVSEKKSAKPSVWSAEFESGKVDSLTSGAKIQREGSDGGGRARGARAVKVVEDDVRVQSFNAAKSNAPASEGRKNQPDSVDDTIFLRYLSPLLPVVVETLLQPEESVPNPLFSTFCSNSSGVWRGVGSTFSPITGDFEPIYLDEDKRNVYDVRVLSSVENFRTTKDGAVLPPEKYSLHRKVTWTLEDLAMGDEEESTLAVQDDDDGSEGDVHEEVDELGYMEDDEEDAEDEDNSEWEIVLAEPREIDERWEHEEEVEGFMEEINEDTGFVREDDTDWNSMWDRREALDGGWEEGGLTAAESGSNLTAEQTTSLVEASTSTSDGPSYDEGDAEETPWEEDVMEEDVLTLEPGLVFFEDGAYSRGPLDLLGEASSSPREYFNVHTFKVEQCLVSGGHKRLRLVHTVSIDDDEKMEVLRLAVYEDEWMGPCNMKSISDAGGHRLKLFSERARHSPEDIVGKWKVFQVEALAMQAAKPSDEGSFVFSCKETSIKRGFPAMPKLTVQEDEAVDLSDFSMSWLTGNVSTYVTMSDTGVLTFGVGWVCEDGTRLVMERAYGEDGKLLHVNSKSEIRVLR